MPDTEHKQNITLVGLTSLTDLDVADMSDEKVKQSLMDLREFGLIRLSNQQIADMAGDDACRMLLDARDFQRRTRKASSKI